MAGTRISQFPNLSSGNLASEDVLLVVDISDTFYSPSGTNKSTTVGDLSNFFSSANDFVGLGDTPAGYGSVGQSVDDLNNDGQKGAVVEISWARTDIEKKKNLSGENENLNVL